MPLLPLSLLPVVFAVQPQVVGAVEQVRIGSDSAPEYEFTRIRQALLDSAGNLYVLLPREAEVRVYTSEGRFLRRIGRKGQGPGEMMFPFAMGWRGDTLWVRDIELNRVNLLSRDGEALRTILDRMPPSPGKYVSGPPAALLSNGWLLGVGDAPSMLVASGQVTSVPMVLFREGSTDARPLRELSLLNLYGNQAARPQQPLIHFQQRLSDAPLWHAAQDGSAIAVVDRPASSSATRSHFIVTILAPDGSTRVQRRIDYAPKPLSRGMRDSVVKITLNPSGRPNMQLSADVVYTPSFLPPITEVFVASDKRVWLRREFTLSAVAEWNIFDPELQLIRSIRLPADFSLLAASGDRFWGTRLGPDDVPYLVRYSLSTARTP